MAVRAEAAVGRAPLRAVGGDAEGELLGWVRRSANRVGLRDYTVELDPDPPGEPDAVAEVLVAGERRLAAFRFCEGFEGLPVEVRRHALAHELAHVVVHPLAERVRSDVGPELGGAAFRVFWGGFRRDLELAVDSFALALADSIPEPPR